MTALVWLLACSGGDLPAAPEEPDDTDGNPFTVFVPADLDGLSSSLNLDYTTLIGVEWTQSESARVHIEYEFAGEVHTSEERDLGAGTHHEWLLGVPYDTRVVWRVHALNSGGATVSTDEQAATPVAPSDLPVPQVLVPEGAAADPDVRYILTSLSVDDFFLGRFWSVIVDRQGRIVWAELSPQGRATMHPRISWHGDAILLDHNSYWGQFDGGTLSVVFAKKMDGTVLRVWTTPGLHHPYTDLPDGSLAYGKIYSGYADETLAVIDTEGSTHEIWSCDQWLRQIGDSDYCGTNTLVYDEDRDVFLFSLFSTDTVVEIDATSGEALRHFGHNSGAWAFDPPSSAFYYQHGGYYTSTGTFLVSTHRDSNTEEIVVREYEVDETTQTLREVWNFGVGDGVWGDQMGEAHRLANGNTLHNSGTEPRLREATPDGDVVWDITWSNRTIGRSAPITGSLYELLPERD